MVEGSGLHYIQVGNKENKVEIKLNGYKQTILVLLHQVEYLEQEKHETSDLKKVVGTLMQ
jgi:hypothetical protein